MRLNTNGLAEGFLAGFRTMAAYQAQQKADQRADESLQMQKDENTKAEGWRQTTYNHSLSREKIADDRYTDETKYNRGRQEKIDKLDEDVKRNQMRNDNARTGFAKQQNDRQAALSEKQDKLTDMQISAAEQQKFTTENWALLHGGWNNIVSGRPVTEQQAKALNDPRAGAMNVNKYTDKNYVTAVTGLQSNVQQIMSTFKPEQFHSQQFYDALNTPQMKQLMGTVFNDEVRRNIGYVDSTGKKVVDKKFAGIAPMENGGLALAITPVYEDGSEGKPQPVTVNRSSDPNDQVQVFNPADIVGVINARAGIAKSIKNPETLLQDIGVVPAADVKGYRKEVTDAILANKKSLAKIDLELSKGNITPERAAELKAIEEDSLRQTLASYKSVYGIEDASNGDNSPAKQVTIWTGNDPQKQQYLQYLVKTGNFDPQNGDVAQLEQGYAAYINEQKNKSLEAAALQEKVDTAIKNQNRY